MSRFVSSLFPMASNNNRNDIVSTDLLDPEEAETQLIQNLERRSFNLGKVPPPQRVSSMSEADEQGQSRQGTEKKPPRLKDIVRRVKMVKQSSARMANSSSSPVRRHRKTTSTAQELLDAIHEIGREEGEMRDSDGRMRDSRMLHSSIFPSETASDTSDFDFDDELEIATGDSGKEELPLLQQQGYGSISLSPTEGASIALPTVFRGSKRQMKRLARKCVACLAPRVLLRFIIRKLICSYLVMFGFPLFILAWILYYDLGNPELDFLPGTARISWWCNFFGRQIVTFELARITQWIVLDLLVTGSRWSVRFLGALTAMAAIQARGWPFLITAWSCWDLFLLHGDNKFQTHWFHWTGLKIYSAANSGTYILTSTVYLRLLLSAILAGVLTTGKRTFVAISLGKKLVADFKPRMEKIFSDVVLLNEIAILADQSQYIEDVSTVQDVSRQIELKHSQGPGIDDVAWSDVVFSDHHSDLSMEPAREDDDEDEGNSPRQRRGGDKPLKRAPLLSKSSSGSVRIKNQLDRWEEPKNKADKTAEASIHEVLKFRRALHYMDNEFPFGDAFGPAGDRNECLESSHAVYWKLLKFLPGSKAVNFDVLALIASEDDGSEDRAKKGALRRLFRPDWRNELSLLAFIQTCDSVYKRLCFFRASVGNASVIDHVLESIINGVFYFVLTLLLLSIMQFNPWPLLVSISSLTVSVSFALGSSVSKYVEGILLIAVRRPYDLGDRIIITGPEFVESPGSPSSWFVEDINLFSTTLRFARTNEVSTVNNWSISSSRIVNCNRSPNAIVHFDVKLHASILDGDTLNRFRRLLEKYVDENPRIWDSIAFIRHEMFDADMEQINFNLAFRHRNSWQDASRILLHRADLCRYVYECSKKLEVQYESTPARRLLYYGGVLQQGEVQDYKKNLLRPTNIRSHSQEFDDRRTFEKMYQPGSFDVQSNKTA